MRCRMIPACAFLLIAAALAHADPLTTAAIPEDTRWIIHLNIDAVRGTPLWEMIRTKLIEPQRPQFAHHIEMIETLTGIHIGQDFHDITLYGASFDETSVCIMIHAPIDQAKIITFLKRDPEFTTADHNGHAILTWRDKQRDVLMHGIFAAGNVIIVSPANRMVGLALDTLDGKSASLKPDSPLAPPALPPPATEPVAGPRNTMVFWIASSNIFDLQRTQKVQSPFIMQMEDAAVSLSILQDHISARLTISAKSDKIAQQLAASGEGVKAMIALSAADEHAPPGTKILASILQNLTFTLDGKNISAEWSVGMDKLEALVDIVRANQPATTAAPAVPVQPLLDREK